MIDADREARLAQFADFVANHLKGDEKGESQLFLDGLFRAFGHDGARQAGAVLEARIDKPAGAKGKWFADCLWPGRVLIEMKKRGEPLGKHFDQVRDYWWYTKPKPPYVLLCNFDEVRVYDFINQNETPVDTVATRDLAQRWGALAFLFPEPRRPVFQNDQVAVTRKAADLLADCFKLLVAPNRLGGPVQRDLAQRFILQSLVALFAEDIGLLQRYLFVNLLEDCRRRADSYDLLGGLFDAMNTPGRTPGGRYAGVDYFNGGLFADPARVELLSDEVAKLKEAAREDWSKVRPEIFGTLFEHTTEKEDRRAFGAHFTSPDDIMKIVRPTIIEPWRERIDGAETYREMASLYGRIQNYTVLDPACGSGNFLYIAYRELKRLEKRLIDRMAEYATGPAAGQVTFGFVTARQFFGLDIKPFAVELAKVSMTMARKLAIDELHINEPALPLANLDENFRAGDALLDDLGNPAAWPKVDVIIGNPPFLGAKLLKPQRGADYVNTVRKAYPEIPGMADYCVYWFRKAHDALPRCTEADPLAGRAGLVGTQNIRNNQSRVGGLDHVVKDGTIIEAVDNQPWSGEANVHVSIANWVKAQNVALLPSTRRLWTKATHSGGTRSRRNKEGLKTSNSTPGLDYELASRDCASINSSLSDGTDVSTAFALECNTKPQRCFNGQMLGHQGFLLTVEQRHAIVSKDPESAQVIFPYLNGVDALTTLALDRYVLDFEQRNQFEAASFHGAFSWVKDHVLSDRERKAEEGKDKDGKQRSHHKAFLARWWQLSFGRPEMLSVIKPLPRYLACAYVTKRPIFMFINSAIRPSNLIQVFGFADDYSFGVLQSHVHWLWFITKCGKLKSDFRYSAESVFDTFPWPQSPTPAQIDAVAEAGRAVRREREAALKLVKGGLRAVYRTLELPGKSPLKDAHAALDRAVLAAYGFDPKADLLAQLLALNLAVAARETAGEPVTAPGIPPGHPDPARLVTADCIRPD